MEAVAWDLRWRMALGLPVDHTGWHPTTLTKFRARLLLHGKERLALENTLRLAEELGLLDASAEQIVDSTPTWRRRHAGHRAAGALGGQEADRCGGGGLSRGRRRARGRARVRLRAPEREARLPLAGEGRAGADADPGGPGRGARAGALEREPQAASRRAGGGRSPSAARADRAGLRNRRPGRAPPSPRHAPGTDPCTTRRCAHGHKSQSRRFDGYKLSAAVSNGPSHSSPPCRWSPPPSRMAPKPRH
jgi:hypothetical protein